MHNDENPYFFVEFWLPLLVPANTAPAAMAPGKRIKVSLYDYNDLTPRELIYTWNISTSDVLQAALSPKPSYPIRTAAHSV